MTGEEGAVGGGKRREEKKSKDDKRNKLLVLGFLFRSNFLVRRSRMLRPVSINHLTVRRDTMTISSSDRRIRVVMLLCRCPSQIIPPNLNIIVGKLAELIVVHAQELGLLARAKLESGDLIDDEADEGGDDKSVRGAGNDVGELDVELLPLLVDEAAHVIRVHAVEADDVVGAEQGIEDEADHAGDAMLSEYVHCVVDADQVLHLGAIVADDPSYDSQEDAGMGHDEAGCWRCRHEARDEA